MPIAAAIPAIIGVASAGATIYSASQASKAAKKGLAAQQTAADRAAGLEEQKYADLAPWRSYGLGALQQLAQVNGISIPQSALEGAGVEQSAGEWQSYLNANPDVATRARAEISNPNSAYYGKSPAEFAQGHFQEYGQKENRPGAPGAAPAANPSNPTAASADPRLAGFFASPDYGFRVQEGTSAITGNAASRGLLDSGATGKALINYGQQAGSAEFSNWYNRLAAAAGVGQAATTQSGQALTNQGTIGTTQAQNTASSYQDQAKGSNNLIKDLVGIGSGLLSTYGSGAAGSGGIPGYTPPPQFSVSRSGAFPQPPAQGLLSLYGSNL